MTKSKIQIVVRDWVPEGQAYLVDVKNLDLNKVTQLPRIRGYFGRLEGIRTINAPLTLKHKYRGTIYRHAIYKNGHRFAICKTLAGNEIMVLAKNLILSIDK